MNIDIHANYIHMLLNEHMISLKQNIFWDEENIYFIDYLKNHSCRAP
jgi:hypothetical protein